MPVMMEQDERFMSVAIDCARRGRGAVEPNPMVGAVIVRDGVEIARGWHRRFGGPHAERDALAAARDAGANVRGATMYVTLEPCCHYGKTPPCTDALLESGIARVVVGMLDPDERVSGRGVEILRSAGADVTVGVREGEVRELLAPYVKLRRQRRPWVICKWAQTADGLLAMPPGEGRWISGEASRRHVHELRGLCDGILVGVGTVLADDPLLTNRSGIGKQPVRVVLDSHLRTPSDCQLLRTLKESPVLIATTPAADGAAAGLLQTAGAEIVTLPASPTGVDLGALLDELGRRQWTHLLVEGGAGVLRSFLDGGLADELLVYVAPHRCPDAPEDLPRFDIARIREQIPLVLHEEQTLGADRMLRLRTA